MATEPQDSGARPLDYAPPPGHGRRIARSLLPLLVLALPLGAAWVMPYVQRARELSLQDKCLDHALPPDTIVYTDDPAEKERLLAAAGPDAGYTDRLPLLGPTDAVVHTPPVWSQYEPTARAGGIAFLHRLRSPGGNTRLVAVDVRPTPKRDGPAELADVIGFGAQVIRPATPGGDRQHIQLRGQITLLEARVRKGDRFRLFAGQPDGTDPSRFTIRYTHNGTAGILDGSLRDDDLVVLAPRHHAASAGGDAVWHAPPDLPEPDAPAPDVAVAAGGSEAESEPLALEPPPPALVIWPGPAGMLRGRAVVFPYNRFVAIRDGGQVVLLVLRPGPGREDGVTYEWFAPGPEGTVRPAPGGSGRAREAGGKGVVRAGPFELEWSQGGPHSGWVYFPAARPNLAISMQAWPSADEVNLNAPDVSWVGPASRAYNR
jgi:hypothetical protein